LATREKTTAIREYSGTEFTDHGSPLTSKGVQMKSMTGYGKGEVSREGLSVTVEIRAVNHRYADINIKLPRSLMTVENLLRKQIGQELQRGKIDVFVNYELVDGVQAVPVLDRELARAYRDLFADLQETLGLRGELTAEFVAWQKDVVEIKEAEIDQDLLAEVLQEAAALALAQHVGMRRAEGEQTLKDVEQRFLLAEQLVTQIEARAPLVPDEWRNRLQERLSRLPVELGHDPQRVAQEVALFADRCDISEEITRFRSHLGQFRELFDDPEPVGRRMDFLVQELNREVNTMGSKANDAELTRHVVALKAELEKVREQVQNIE